jgi:hypothetical protein
MSDEEDFMIDSGDDEEGDFDFVRALDLPPNGLLPVCCHDGFSCRSMSRTKVNQMVMLTWKTSTMAPSSIVSLTRTKRWPSLNRFATVLFVEPSLAVSLDWFVGDKWRA